MNSQAMMGVGGEDDKLENGSGGGGGFFESFKVTRTAEAEAGTELKASPNVLLRWKNH